ncbi:MAG: type IX secretion system membrane protein PorP/SprF [Opitutaceae bacterium]|nr:type IX secretion system membrane protein PorP/SprF [Cytophagales bacterium]
MKKVIIFIALNSIALTEGFSQGFSHIYQAPLLLNPSFAGSTGGARLAAVTNFGQINGAPSQNNYLSFDHLLKKYGIGLGGTVYTFKGSDGDGINYANSTLKYQTIGGDLTIAPKYLLKKRNGDKRATFSPSLAIGYKISDIKSDLVDYSILNGLKNSYDYSNYSFERISDRLQYSKDLKLSLGLLYNSEKLIMGLVLENHFVEKNYSIYRMYVDSSSGYRFYSGGGFPGNFIITDSSEVSYSRSIRKKDPDIHLKSSIPILSFHLSKIMKMGSSKFSIVPSINFGFAYYKRPKKSYSSDYSDISLYKLNAALQLNYGKIFFGGGLSTTMSSCNMFAGFKNDKIKIMGSYNFLPKINGNPSSYSNRSFELSVNYNLKFKKR